MSNSLTVRLTDSRSSARRAPISYTPPVKPPPPSTKAVRERLGRGLRAGGLDFALGRSVAAVSSLTTFPMLSLSLCRLRRPPSLLPRSRVSYRRMRRYLLWVGALLLVAAAPGAAAASERPHSAQGDLDARLGSDMSQIGGASGALVVGRVVGDESYFDSLRGTSESGFQFDHYLEGSLSALAFDRGVTGDGSTYIYHPAIYAAQRLVEVMPGAGIKVSVSVGAGQTPKCA